MDSDILKLYQQIYGDHPRADHFLERLDQTLKRAWLERSPELRQRDMDKGASDRWFLSNQLAGMSLYVDRWCGKLEDMSSTLPYLQELGVNLVHLMPLFESPPGESDGGYAVSDFRRVDSRFGSIEDLRRLRSELSAAGMYLMLDIVLNHTSNRHEWAVRARQGEEQYQDYYYMFQDRGEPDLYELGMPEVFPESSPGNFTYVEECRKWVMTVFHNYQWDLNFRNPQVFVEMIDTILFYGNLGVDILRIDAPAFIWKEVGTTCQNLPGAHALLRLIKACAGIVSPGMAILGEAIVAPSAIMKYFGTGEYEARECDFAYNATQMALQWDALATGDVRVMLAEQPKLETKPFGCSWITYTRCHDDIGLGYEDSAIVSAGYDPAAHRRFLMDYYTGRYPGSDATGALFSANPKTQDARISGTLASLCGLESALGRGDEDGVRVAIRRILLMQAQSLFIGGTPMLFYGDEAGYTNDYSYLADEGKSYDNRWMHRPVVDWSKNARVSVPGTVEEAIYSATRRLIALRKKLSIFSDRKNIRWVAVHNRHIACFVRSEQGRRVYCVFNFSPEPAGLTWYAFREGGERTERVYDHWGDQEYVVGKDEEYLHVEPYGFMVLDNS